MSLERLDFIPSREVLVIGEEDGASSDLLEEVTSDLQPQLTTDVQLEFAATSNIQNEIFDTVENNVGDAFNIEPRRPEPLEQIPHDFTGTENIYANTKEDSVINLESANAAEDSGFADEEITGDDDEENDDISAVIDEMLSIGAAVADQEARACRIFL